MNKIEKIEKKIDEQNIEYGQCLVDLKYLIKKIKSEFSDDDYLKPELFNTCSRYCATFMKTQQLKMNVHNLITEKNGYININQK